MNVKLFFEKIKLALQKRTGLTQQKNNYASWIAKGYCNDPLVTIVIQSHNKSLQICHFLPKLRKIKNVEIIVIDDGSTKEHTDRLVALLTGANEFLFRANDLFENVTYDKAIRLANGKYVALLQDDDDFDGTGWIERSVSLFEQHKKLAILGGRDALEIVCDDNRHFMYGEIVETKSAFSFATMVNRAPMWVNRDLYMQHLHHINFSFAPFQYDDYEICLRAWLCGLQVGLYDAGFRSLTAGGMRLWNKEFTKEQSERNGHLLYELYADKKDKVALLVETANNNLSA